MYDFQYFRRWGVAADLSFTIRVRSATNVLPPDPLPGAGIAAAECQISKDFGAFANTTNLPSSLGLGLYRLTLTATEMQANFVDVVITDGAGAWIPVHLSVEMNLGLRTLNVTNDAGDGVTFASTGSNGRGLVASGNGSGHGFQSTGGLTGDGIRGTGGATSGHGVSGVAATSGSGFNGAGAGSGSGALVTGGATGHGVLATGGATSGHGFSGVAQAGNSNGMVLQGQGSGGGFTATGGATGPGGVFAGGATSGDGLRCIAQLTGHGAEFLGAGSTRAGMHILSNGYHGIDCESAGGNFHAAHFRASGAGNGEGIRCTGKGTGSGLRAEGGATGAGITGVGGGTSGDGIRGEATGGTNAGFKGQGTGAGYGMWMAGGAVGARFSNTVASAVELAESTNSAGATFVGATSGILFNGGTGDGAIFTGANGATFRSVGGAAGDAAMKLTAGASSYGLRVTGRPTVPAIRIDGSTSEAGIQIAALTGIDIDSTGIGIDIDAGTSGITIDAASGDALRATVTGGNGSGFLIAGFGAGHGLSATGGTNGDGLRGRGGTTQGEGLDCAAVGSGHGALFTAVGASQHGLYAKAGTTNAHGIFGEGGTGSGNGARFAALAGNSSGLFGLRQGTGHGIEGSPDIFPTFSADELTGGDPVGVLADNPSFRELFKWMGVYFFNDATQSNTLRTFRNNANNATLGVQAVNFNVGTGLQTQGKLS